MCISPQLIAAYHVLHRLSEPRHPPCALSCFKKFEIVIVTRPLRNQTNQKLGDILSYVIDNRLSSNNYLIFSNMSKSYRRFHRLLWISRSRCSDYEPVGLMPTSMFERTFVEDIGSRNLGRTMTPSVEDIGVEPMTPSLQS